MLYPFMTLDDGTEIVHSETLPDGRVRAYMEKPDAPEENATKIWITRRGKCLLFHNKSRIPTHTLRNIMAIIEARSDEIVQKWQQYFGERLFFC